MFVSSTAASLLTLSLFAGPAAAVHLPKEMNDYKIAMAPNGVPVRYKNPGICETTPGVNSYAGYVDLAPNVHIFYWFFESRNSPATDPITLWLNGGPGGDSLAGLFEENGPCTVNENLATVYNPYSWNNVSNMLYISQPVGVGFSYQTQGVGSFTRDFYFNSTEYPATGRWPLLDPLNQGTVDTTDIAAIATWHVLQALLATLPQFDAKIGKLNASREFNLFTESYGGHYGPAFFEYFSAQNTKIKAGSMSGTPLNFNSLGIINGIISEQIQAKYYPEFAVNNTYGIKAYNDTVYSYVVFANNMRNGCQDQIATCIAAAQGTNGTYYDATRPITTAELTPATRALCSEAQSMCRDNVEGPYYQYSGRGSFDIRHPANDPTPPHYWRQYLNLGPVQEALGVSLNHSVFVGYSPFYAFQKTGDFIFPNFLLNLKHLLDRGVRVSLAYGDADYICNWFGGEAVSLAVDYAHSKEFRAAGYAPMTVDGTQYGEVRQYGNFSFLILYEAGHEMVYYQPAASLAYFNRTLFRYSIADGKQPVTANLTTFGPPDSTHTNPFVSLTSSSTPQFPTPWYPPPKPAS
ncbi:hypothetical protein ACEQ8H_005390 [Pleosporales sp. CAS-2024a]